MISTSVARPHDRDALVRDYKYLCTRGARKFLRPTLERADLEQVAAIGLIKAARRFDPAMQTPFEAYAWIAIIGELIVDVDDFKTVNDTRGHAGGDTVLKTVAAALQQTSRTRDIVGRYAGDEFNVVLIDVDEERARSLVRRLSATLRLSGIRCSIGVALYPSDATNESQLMRAADEALYAAKQNGKNGYAFYRSRKAREE